MPNPDEYDCCKRRSLLSQLVRKSGTLVLISVVAFLYFITCLLINFAQLVNLLLFQYTFPSLRRHINWYLQELILSRKFDNFLRFRSNFHLPVIWHENFFTNPHRKHNSPWMELQNSISPLLRRRGDQGQVGQRALLRHWQPSLSTRWSLLLDGRRNDQQPGRLEGLLKEWTALHAHHRLGFLLWRVYLSETELARWLEKPWPLTGHTPRFSIPDIASHPARGNPFYTWKVCRRYGVRKRARSWGKPQVPPSASC